jgi:hypothetical protein
VRVASKVILFVFLNFIFLRWFLTIFGQGQYPFFLRTWVLLIERLYNCFANLMVLLNFVSFWSQGLRGAMAFALALQSVTDLPNNHGRVLLTATLFTIIFTVKPPPVVSFHPWSIYKFSSKLMVAHTCQTNSCRLLKRLVERHCFFYWWKYKIPHNGHYLCERPPREFW